MIGQGNFCETFHVEDKHKKSYAAQVFYVDYEDYEKLKQYQMESTIFLVTNLKHHAILKGYDYSLFGFGKEHWPSILFDYLPNGSLEKCILSIVQKPKNNKFIPNYICYENFISKSNTTSWFKKF